jgi:hypothetical protein
MNDSKRQTSLGGYVGRRVVRYDGSLCAFYRLEGGQKMGREGMRPTAMVDIQYVGFIVEGEPRGGGGLK